MREKWYLLCAGPTRLEPATSGLTGRRSNQLNYNLGPIDTLQLVV